MEFKFGIARSIVVTGLLASAALPFAASAAYAAPAPSHHASSAHRTTTLTTRTAKVHIRSKAKLSKRSTILATLPRAGSRVTVKCYKTGASVSGDATWYRTVSPRAGFVAGHELNISHEPVAGVPSCKAKKK